MPPPTPEDRVRQLAKHNTVCPNCHQSSVTGFGTICIKFHTFVCNECKSSHQAISHRCKSITMSMWTHEEVDQLELKGNNHCEATWLAKAPAVGQAGRPTAGSSIDVFKRFVIDVYEHQKYYVAASAATAAKKPTVPLAAAKDNTHSQQPVSSTFLAAAPSQQPVPDFLDFASFEDTNNAGSVWPKVETAPCPTVFSTPTTVDPFACAEPFLLDSVYNNSNNYSIAPVPFDPFAPTGSTTQQSLNNTTATTTSFPRFHPTTNNTVNTGSTLANNNNNAITNMPIMMNNNSNSYPMTTPAIPRATGMPTPPMNHLGMMMPTMTMPSINNTMMNHNNHGMFNSNMGGPMGGMYNNSNQVNNSMATSSFGPAGPVLSYHGGSSAISNIGNAMQQQQQKQKDAFSDLVPF